MKVFLITFICIFPLFLFAQQKVITKKSAFISGKVTDEKNNPLSAHIEVFDNQTKELIGQAESSSSGSFRIPASKKNSCIVYASKLEYLFQSVITAIPDTADYEKTLPNIIMQKVEVGKKIILNNISFDFYQAVVLDESRLDLERIISLMNEKPGVQVEIGGFTDKIGSDKFNKQSSEQRTKAVVDVLILSGFDNTRMKYKGYGPAQPRGSNFTEEGRQMNNRIELKILKLDLAPKKGSELKQKKGVLPIAVKTEDNPNTPIEEDKPEITDTVKVVKKTVDLNAPAPKDTLARIDYKGMFIADKAPLANSTVNLLGSKGEIYKTTKTDQHGAFQFLDIEAEQEVTFGLDAQETKKFKKISLADTTGAIVKELSKINGEFVLALLPSEKLKLGTVYLVDPPLKIIKVKSKNAFIIGRVIDENGYPLKVQIDIIDKITNQTVEKSNNDAEGRYNISLPPGKDYDLVYNKSGYLFQSVNVQLPDSIGFQKNLDDVTLQKVEAGKKIVLSNIFFDSNQSTLRNESFSELQRAAKLINDMTSMEIEISGHTDNVGSVKNNRQLSEQRAKAVTDYLISKGCDKSRLKYKGYGSLEPIATNNTEEGRQQNRRTEFKVLKVDLVAEQVTKAKKMKETIYEAADSKHNLIPERLKKFDTDKNGIISYEEIMVAIDAFFEENPKAKEERKASESISALFDFYFEQ